MKHTTILIIAAAILNVSCGGGTNEEKTTGEGGAYHPTDTSKVLPSDTATKK